MKQIYFTYGTMNSEKSAQLLMIGHNYESKGVEVHYVKPKLDTRETTIKSRVGIEAKVDYELGDNYSDNFKFFNKALSHDAVVLIDEAQFVPYDMVKAICTSVREAQEKENKYLSNFAIMAFGLLTDFHSKLFDGTKAWLEEADSIRETKNICDFCSQKATKNYLDKKYQNANSNIVMGDEQYHAVCARHYLILQQGE